MKMDICCEQKRIREFLFLPTDLLNHNNKNGAGQTFQIITFLQNPYIYQFRSKVSFFRQNIRIVAFTTIIMCLQQKIPTGKRFQISKVGLRKVIHTHIRRRTHEKLRRI